MNSKGNHRYLAQITATAQGPKMQHLQARSGKGRGCSSQTSLPKERNEPNHRLVEIFKSGLHEEPPPSSCWNRGYRGDTEARHSHRAVHAFAPALCRQTACKSIGVF